MLQRHFEVRDDTSHTLHWVGPRLFLAALLCVVQLFRIGFYEDQPFLSESSYVIIENAVLALLTGAYLLLLIRRADRWDWLKRRWREPLVLLVIIAAWAFGKHQLYTAITVFLVILLFTRVYVVLTDRLTRPGLLFVSSFITLILAGMLLLKLPAAVPSSTPLSWVDALFTSTSAVCVTGLIVRDTATQFTHFGQVIILVLIQLGGLGIILFGALFAVMFGGSISLRQATSIGEVVESSESGLGNVDRLVRFVVIATLATEAVGAALIYLLAPSTLSQGAQAGSSVFNSIFISISSFCNAGFAPFTQSLVDYDSRFTVGVIVTVLIVVGGLGFPVLFNITEVGLARLKLKLKFATPQQINKRHIVRLNLHTKIVLMTSILLYVGGTLGLFFGQFTADQQPNTTALVSETVLNMDSGESSVNSSSERSTGPGEFADDELSHGQSTANSNLGRQLADASFMSVSARTAGFNSLPMDELAPASRYILIMLMFIGGSPGSTAGGIKTIVLAILVLSIWSTIRGRRETEVFGRSIPFELVRRAGVAASLGLLTIAGTTLALTLVAPAGLENDLFEAVSACGTVGLSMGITADLTTAGKIVLVMGMFLGRIGPLALIGVIAFGATKASRHARYRYPQEPVVMG